MNNDINGKKYFEWIYFSMGFTPQIFNRPPSAICSRQCLHPYVSDTPIILLRSSIHRIGSLFFLRRKINWSVAPCNPNLSQRYFPFGEKQSS